MLVGSEVDWFTVSCPGENGSPVVCGALVRGAKRSGRVDWVVGSGKVEDGYLSTEEVPSTPTRSM